MERWTREEIDRALRQVEERASRDRAFRERALADPDAVLEELTGRRAPPGCKLRIVEHAPGYHLPTLVPLSGAARLRMDLDEVAKKLFG
ncbi:MAG: hypothetical protein HY815_08430 [Candidatus Riflebacteria bacterium]|nr:hypothetical protein [Candidatus Riflebacteria bacterium]